MGTTTLKKTNYKAYISKCFIQSQTNEPDIYYRIKEYNSEENCFYVEGFINSYNYSISTIMNNRIPKHINFMVGLKEITETEYLITKEKLISNLN